MVSRPRKVLTYGLAVASATVLTAAVISVPSPVPAAAHGGLRIVTANLYYANRRPAAASQRLAALNADVLVMLERSVDNLDTAMLSGADRIVVIDEPRAGTHGIAIIARAALAPQAALLPAPAGGPCAMPMAVLRWRTRRDWLALVAIHAPPPIAACRNTNAPTLATLAGWVDGGRLSRDLGPARRGDRVLVAGDLNTLPGSTGMAALRVGGLVDSYAAVQWRPGPTWSPHRWLPAMARIDYILAPADLSVRRAATIGLPGSDHRAILADFDDSP